MEGHCIGQPAKMGHGVIRYSSNPIVAVIDSFNQGSNMSTVAGMPLAVPIVGSVKSAFEAGAEVLVLGIAPPGGLIPVEWYSAIDEAIALGMSVINGLHDLLGPRYTNLQPKQWVWDVRVEPLNLAPGYGRAAKLENRRVLMIGTDMSIGKMTAGLEIYRNARERGVRAEFIATGQIGITVSGRGVPLDAIRLDFAAGAIEREVLQVSEAEMVIIEGQGSLIHPASSANLPLLRGGCPTHLVLCHRAGQESLYRLPEVHIPPLADVLKLYEALAEACGTFLKPVSAGVALNTFHIESEFEAREACERIEQELGLPCVDPVRHGPERLVDSLLS
jgi:uncharacterized NAD-dependent epimerase/dehydratase family protein